MLQVVKMHVFLHHKEVIKIYGFRGKDTDLVTLQIWKASRKDHKFGCFFHVFQLPTATECQSCQSHRDHYVSIIIYFSICF